MGEDLGDHGGIYDGGNDLQGAAALGAVFQARCPVQVLDVVANGILLHQATAF